VGILPLPNGGQAGRKDWLHFSHEQPGDELWPSWRCQQWAEVHLKLKGAALGGPGGRRWKCCGR
jgi:hypothetical protein